MNKLFLATGIIICMVITVNGQLSLEQTYNYSVGVVKLETLGYKYFLMDVPNSQCRIYNLDHSLFKTINCAVPANNYLSDIKYVSQNLFDSDSDIELVYTYYEFVQPTETTYYYKYHSRVINENGSNMLDIDEARFIFVYKSGDIQYKLFAFCYDYSVWPELIWTKVYSLPGVYVSAETLASAEMDMTLNAYPNPASDVIRLTYQLPENTGVAKLNLMDSNGRMIRNFTVDDHIDYIELNVNGFSPGVYYYNIDYNNFRSPSKKIVIQ